MCETRRGRDRLGRSAAAWKSESTYFPLVLVRVILSSKNLTPSSFLVFDLDTLLLLYTLSSLHPTFLDFHFHHLPSFPIQNMPSATSTATSQPNGDVRNRNGIAAYTKHWQTDSSKDTEEHTKDRLEKYTDVVNGYYDGATDLSVLSRSLFIPLSLMFAS